MVNFRYHVVSLIAIFLALSVGVVLGAGPLQSRLSDVFSSSDQSSTTDLSGQLQAARSEADSQGKAFTELAGRVLPGTLDGISVATVALPGATADDVTSVDQDLKTAGATVVGAVTLSDNWDSTGMATYRESLASPVASHLEGTAPTDATGDAIIGFAIVRVLTATGAEPELLKGILTSQSTPILTFDQDPNGAAQAIVVVGPRADAAAVSPSSDATATSTSSSAWAGLGQAIATAPKSGVILGDASGSNSVVSQIRSQEVAVTTVDPVGSELGSFSAVLALSSAGQEARAFGVGNAATAVLPPIKGVGEN